MDDKKDKGRKAPSTVQRASPPSMPRPESRLCARAGLGTPPGSVSHAAFALRRSRDPWSLWHRVIGRVVGYRVWCRCSWAQVLQCVGNWAHCRLRRSVAGAGRGRCGRDGGGQVRPGLPPAHTEACSCAAGWPTQQGDVPQACAPDLRGFSPCQQALCPPGSQQGGD